MNGLFDLENMSSEDLIRLRSRFSGDKVMDPLLAPAEHMDFARTTVQDNPLMALPLAAATPLYYMAKQPMMMDIGKRMGLVGQQATPASIDQLFAAYRGIGQGLFGR